MNPILFTVVADNLEHLYDAGVVWTFEIQVERVVAGDSGELGFGVF